jgi:hypothetical protein
MIEDLLGKHKEDPSWSEVIRLYSGLFESQNERENFILDLAQTNILLSAECKMTSISEEEELENQIITIAFYNFRDNDDYLSLFTLINMGEYLIARDVLTFKYKTNISEIDARRSMLNHEEPIKFIEQIYKIIPRELSSFLLQVLENNLVKFSTSYYEVLIGLSEPIQAVKYFHQMKNEGVIPNERILNLMITKDGINNAVKYYDEFDINNIKPTISTLKSFLLLKGVKFPEIVNSLFNSINFKSLSKRQLTKLYVSYMNYQSSYTLTLFFYHKLLDEYRERYGEELNTATHLRIIGILINASDNMEIAEQWYSYAHSKFSNRVTGHIYTSYLFKISNGKINEYIRENYSNLLPKFDSTKLNDDKRDSINSFLLLFFSKLVKYQVTFNSIQLILDEINSRGINANYKVLKTIIEVFNSKEALEYLIPHFKYAPDFKPNNWTFLLKKFEPLLSMDLFIALKNHNQHKSIFIYNCIIDKCDNYNTSLIFIDEMTDLGISPDKVTFTTLIKQSKSLSELINVILLCSNNKISPDSFMENALYKQLQLFKSEFYDYFNNNSKALYDALNSRYFQLLNDFENKSYETK